MRWLGEGCLLGAFVAETSAVVALHLGLTYRHAVLRKSGILASVLGALALTVSLLILANAFLDKDFAFACVQQYSDRALAWPYSLSALWVGQGGSLLLWTWFCAALSLVSYIQMRQRDEALAQRSLHISSVFICFLTTVIAFAADPMAASIVPSGEGVGLNPVLQHPAMLVHPPIVFLGYALWTIPFSLAVAVLINGQESAWMMGARPWALAGWLVLGCGILVGGYWAYHELGWGGYWTWDPVENGSFIPWLLGTATLHAMMAWRQSGVLKKSALSLCLATFAACNFATFLTRSGIFSSLHAFSRSPIGWLFLGWMAVIATGGALQIARRRRDLQPERRLSTLWCREAMISLSILSLSTLAVLIGIGTIVPTISEWFVDRQIMVGMSFYNRALIPASLVVLISTSLAPVLRWRTAPRPAQWRVVGIALFVAWCAVGLAMFFERQPLIALLIGVGVFGTITACASIALDHYRWREWTARDAWRLHLSRRRLYAGLVIHGGLFLLSIGVAMSSCGSERREISLPVGQSVPLWNHQVRLKAVTSQATASKRTIQAELIVTTPAGRQFTLVPGQEYHLRQQEWTNEVAIASSWNADFYAILEGSSESQEVHLTILHTPWISLVWLGGWVMFVGAIGAAWPRWQRRALGRRDARAPDRQWVRAAARAAAIFTLVAPLEVLALAFNQLF